MQGVFQALYHQQATEPRQGRSRLRPLDPPPAPAGVLASERGGVFVAVHGGHTFTLEPGPGRVVIAAVTGFCAWRRTPGPEPERQSGNSASGRCIDTIQLGASTISLILRSPATLHRR